MLSDETLRSFPFPLEGEGEGKAAFAGEAALFEEEFLWIPAFAGMTKYPQERRECP